MSNLYYLCDVVYRSLCLHLVIHDLHEQFVSI